MRKWPLLLLPLVACADDTAVIRDRGGVYRITDIDVHPNVKACDRIVVQLADVETHQTFAMSGCGNKGEKILEKLLPILGCVENPADKEKITEVPCG